MSKSEAGGLLLLDTHAWYWLVEDDPRLDSWACLNTVTAAAEAGRLAVSVISAWEIAALVERGRLMLATDPMEWVRAALAAPGLTLVPFTPEIAVESTRLPGFRPRDPADRIIVASARSLGATIVTADEEILDYAETGCVKAISLQPGRRLG